MTEKQVKYAIQRGLGRGILAVRENPERYRDLVLWACGRNLAFDTQCEGARTWYVYQLVCCYEDRAAFRDVIVEKLRRKRPDWGWDICCFSELLSLFAQDGDTAAECALWEKYAELFALLRGFRKHSWRRDATRDELEHVCLALAWKEDNYHKIAADLGAYYLESKLCDNSDFAWLYESRPRGFNSRLRKQAARSPELTAWFRACDARKREATERQENWQPPEIRVSELKGRRLSLFLKHHPELIKQYAETYLSTAEPEARAAALEAFHACPYPLNPTPILADADSKHFKLRTSALEALGEIREPRVRQFAWKRLEQSPEDWLPVAVKNCLPEDVSKLYPWIKKLHIDYTCKSNWHGIHLTVLHLFDRTPDLKNPPKSLLPLIYETTLCSCCRENAARWMGRYHMLTPEMWEEQMYDSYDEIRAHAVAHATRMERKEER